MERGFFYPPSPEERCQSGWFSSQSSLVSTSFFLLHRWPVIRISELPSGMSREFIDSHTLLNDSPFPLLGSGVLQEGLEPNFRFGTNLEIVVLMTRFQPGHNLHAITNPN